MDNDPVSILPPPVNKAELSLIAVKKIDHNRAISFSRISPCGQFIFAADLEAVLHRWTIDKDEKVALKGQHGGWIQGLAFHPDGRRMFTADSWGQIVAWNYADAAPTPLWKVTDCHPTWMRGIALSPDGSTLATCGVDQFIRLWSSADGKLIKELPRHSEQLFCVVFHPDGKSLVSGDLKGNVSEWDLTAKNVKRVLDAKVFYSRPKVNNLTEINDVGGVRSLEFDPNGTTLACGGCEPVTSGFFQAKPMVILFDWKSGERSQSLQPADVTPKDGVVMDIAFHPDGFLVVATSGQPGSGAVWCWKPSEKTPMIYNKKMAHARSARVHPDGQRVVVSQITAAPGASGGNGRKGTSDEAYGGMTSAIHVFTLGPAGEKKTPPNI